MNLQLSARTGRIVSRAGKGNIGLDHARLDLVGGDPGWLDETSFVSMGVFDGRERVVRYDTVTGVLSLALVNDQPLAGGANEVRAGGGRWARWLNIPNVGLQDNRGLHLPDAGLLDVGPDGTLYYTEHYGAGRGIRAHRLDGTDVEVLTPERATALELRGFDGGCVWASYAQQAWYWTPNTGATITETVAGERVYDPSLVRIRDEEWLVYGTQNRIYAHPRSDWRVGYVLHTGRDDFFYTHAVAFNDKIRYGYASDQGAGGLSQRVFDLDLTVQRRQLYPQVALIGRRMWLGFFNRVRPTTAQLPGNCSFYFGSDTDSLIRDLAGNPIAVYAAGPPGQEGNLAALNAAIAAAKVHGLPVLAYWTRALWSGPLPTGADWLGVEGYEQRSEGFAAFEQALIRQCERHPLPVIIGQCYTSNTNNTSELTHLPAIYARMAIRFPNMPMILAFTGEGRGTGYTDHPEASAPWTDLAAGITGAPEIPMPASAKATITSFETPVTLVNGKAQSRAVAKITKGTPTRFMWQYEDRPGHWVDASNPNGKPPGNDPSDLDHHYTFTTPGNYHIRLQTFVGTTGTDIGTMTDQSSSTARTVEVRAASVPIPPEPETPPVEPPSPQPGPHEVLITLRDTRGIPIADAEAWSQGAPTVKVKTNVAGHALVVQTAAGTGVCVLKEGYHSPGLPGQQQTCVPAAPGQSVVMTLEPVPPPPPPGRTGQVYSASFSAADNDGAFLELGATFMWANWGWMNDRPRTEKNMDALAEAQIDFGRMFGAVGSENPSDSWFDRRINPNDPRWQATIRETVEAMAARGRRTQFTVFGSIGYTPTAADRERIVSQACDALLPVAQSVTLFEIANEGWQNGFEGDSGARELQRLVALARSKGPWLVAPTAPRTDSCESQSPFYKGSQATAINLHFDRTAGDNGNRYLRQPYREGKSSCDGFPTKFYRSNEPMEWYGKGDTNLLRYIQHAVITYQCNVGSFCAHVGPGIRGGGSADIAAGRAANFWECPRWSELTKALQAVRANLPKDFASWDRSGDSRPDRWTVNDFKKVIRWYETRRGAVAYGTPHGITGTFTATAQMKQRTQVIDPVSWRVISEAVYDKDQKLTLSSSPQDAYVVRSEGV